MALEPTLVRIAGWIEENYPRPKTDPDWVKACVEFLVNELQLDPARQFDDLAQHVRLQLLQSDLTDSMIGQSGLSETIGTMKNGVIGARADGGPVLVQIVGLTEIGASAFTLTNVRQARLDKADMTGLTNAKDDEANEDEGERKDQAEEEDATMPKYPRSMLSMSLSDGTVTMKAIEFKKIPGLVLGETPLGCKLLLKGVRIRNGIALLEPGNVEIMGYQNDDLMATQDIEFLNSLRRRLGKPEDDLDEYAPVPEQDRRDPNPQPQAGAIVPDSPSARAQDQASEVPSNFSFEEPSGMDEDFFREIDKAEEEILRRPSSQANPNLTQGRKETSTISRVDIIDLDDSSDDEEILPRPRRKVATHITQDPIDLSD